MAACADRNHEELTKQGIPVISPEKLADYNCDAIVVANSFAGVRREIKKELAERYPEKKVYLMDETLIRSEAILRAFGLY